MWVVKKLLIMLGLLVSSLMFVYPDESFACSCAISTPEAAFERSDAVFAGRAHQAVDLRDGASVQSSADPIHYTFEVKEVWKGELGQTVVVKTARNEASCGYNFAADQEYLIYAVDRGDWLETGLCSRTALLTAAGDDLTVLGAGTVNPDYGTSYIAVETWKEPFSPTLLISLALGAVAVVILVWYGWRKRSGR